MSSLNRVILMGHLTRDPQVKQLPSQTTVAEFGIAMNRKFRTQAGEDREEVVFVDCGAFGKTGELIAQWFQKGRAILVEGRLKYDTWDDRNGGGKRGKLSVVVESFTFPPGGGGGDQQQGGGGQSQARSSSSAPSRPGNGTAPSQRPPPQKPAEQPFGDEPVFSEADIPFAWGGRDSTPV